VAWKEMKEYYANTRGWVRQFAIYGGLIILLLAFKVIYQEEMLDWAIIIVFFVGYLMLLVYLFSYTKKILILGIYDDHVYIRNNNIPEVTDVYINEMQKISTGEKGIGFQTLHYPYWINLSDLEEDKREEAIFNLAKFAEHNNISTKDTFK